MFEFLKRYWDVKTPYHPRQDPYLKQPLTPQGLKDVFGGSSDYAELSLYVGGQDRYKVMVAYIDGTVSGLWLSDQILKPITTHPLLQNVDSAAQLFERLSQGGVYNFSNKIRRTMDQTAGDLITGSCAVFVEGVSEVLTFEAKGFPSRGVSEPSGENVLKGSKDGLVETARFNTALIRKHIKTPDLRIQDTTVGRQTKTNLSLVYIEGLTDPALVQEIKQRLDAIDIDGMLMASDLEEYIVDHKMTPLPQVRATERTDCLCNGLLAGQAALLVDGLPFGYLLPVTFAQIMKAPDDYAHNFLVSSLITVFRHISFFVSLLLPGFYLSLVTFHVEMIPTNLAIAILDAKREVPFSSLIELLVMLVVFELLIEAGLRLPQAVGQTVSIVGGLVIGQAAVEANIASPDVIIIIALTAICGFVMPSYDLSLAVRLFRFLFVLAGGLAGLLGISVLGALLVHHMASLTSFGVPYLASFSLSGNRDSFVRTLRPPLWLVKERSSVLAPDNKRNQK